jgi:hypothetical protein
MKVFIIVEECHGTIGVATSPKSAMRWLIDEGWIGEWSDYGVYVDSNEDFDKWKHCGVAEYCEQNGIADWQQWLIDNASAEFLETGFLIYLREHDLAETE